MKTARAMVPDAFIAVIMMSNRNNGTLYIGVTNAPFGTTCARRSRLDAGFLGGRDNGPAMTRFVRAGDT
jgi:hypothetical protein